MCSFAIKASHAAFRAAAALVTATRRRGGDLAFVLTVTKRGGFLRRCGDERMSAAGGLALTLRIRRGIRLVGTAPGLAGLATSESDEISMTSWDNDSFTAGTRLAG